MPATKPMRGFPSTTAAVVALEREGLDDYAIVQRLELPLKTVRQLKKQRQLLVPKRLNRKPKLAAKVEIPRAIVSELERHALRREITPQECIRRLIRNAVADGLVDAILDDDGQPDRAKRRPSNRVRATP